MNIPFFIAKRYLLSKSKNNTINFITIIAALGIVIGSASLFIVLSGFGGLKNYSLQFTNYIDPDLKIVSTQGKSFVVSEDKIKLLKDLPNVLSFSKIVEDQAVLSSKNKRLMVQLKGVGSNYPKTSIDSILVEGQWVNGSLENVVSGWNLSALLGFGISDFNQNLKLYVLKPGKGQISSINSVIKSIPVINVGLFEINENLDNSLVFAHINTVQHLLNYEEDQITGLEIILANNNQLDETKATLQKKFGNNFIIKTRAQLNDALYKMLNTEYFAVYLIFTLVLIIALFNVVGSIIMMILDKKNNLNTLFSLGVTLPKIRKIFFLHGSLMSAFGGFLGVLLGLVLVINQKYGPEFLRVYIIPDVISYPVVVKPLNVIIVLVTICVLGIIASKIASSRITERLLHFN